MVKEEVGLPPIEMIKKLGAHMPRYRFQRGFVKIRGTRVKKWVGYFHIYVTGLDGKEHRRVTSRVIGLKTDLRKSEAEGKLAAIIAKETGRAQIARPDPDSSFEWFWTNRFLPIKEPKWSDNQRETVTGIFSRHVLPKIGRVRLSDLNRFDLQMLVNQLSLTHSESVVDKVYTYLKAVLEEAVEQDYLAKNPARKLELPEVRKPCERFLTEAEISKMLNALSGKNRLIFHCLVTLALRPGELFAVRIKDVQPGQIQIDEQTYRNRLKAPKTRSSIAPVVLPTALETELRRWIATLTRHDPDDFVFESRRHRRPMDPRRYLRDVLQPKAKELGIEGFTYQAVRRTFATQAMEAGANLKHIQGQMRHAHAKMTDSYTKTIEQGQREAVERFDRKFFGEQAVGNEKTG